MVFTRRMLAAPLAGLVLALAGCTPAPEPIIGKWSHTPNMPVQVQLVVEFRKDGTGAFDMPAIESAVPANLKALPMAQTLLAGMKSSTLKWEKKGPAYQLTWNGQPYNGIYHFKVEGDQMAQCDESGKPLQGSPAWTRVKEAK